MIGGLVQTFPSARAQEYSRLRTGKEFAEVLLRQATGTGLVRAELQLAAAGKLGLVELDAVLARARQMLFQPASPRLGDSQRAIAARLAQGEKAGDFEAWRRKLASTSPRIDSLLGHVAELELLGESSGAAELHEQVLAVAEMTEGSAREMRLDSLELLLRKTKDSAVEMVQLRRQVSLLIAELGVHSEAADAVSALKAAAHSSCSELNTAIEHAERRLSESQAAQAADARRKSVLDGLQELGYEVQEELSTATPAGGRLVVRRPATAGYGVEIAAGAGMERLQVRTVALDADRDVKGDVPAEQQWCDDFGTLQKVMKSKGAEVVIEKALGVGVVPVKLLVPAREELRRTAFAPPQAARK